MAEEIEKEQEQPPEGLVILDVPRIHATSFQYHMTSNEISMTFQQVRTTTTPDGVISKFAKVENVAQLILSPQSAKDLWLLLDQNFPLFEKEFGTVTTAYSKQIKK